MAILGCVGSRARQGSNAKHSSMEGRPKSSKGEELQEMCIHQEREGLTTSIHGSLVRCREGLKFLRKFGGSCSLKLKRDGNVFVEMEMERKL